MDSAEGSDQGGGDSMLQDLRSVRLAVEQMEAAVSTQSTSTTIDVHMQQAVEVIRFVCGCKELFEWFKQVTGSACGESLTS